MTATVPPVDAPRVLAALLAEAERYYSDVSYRLSMPCSECGIVGGCDHFPNEADDA